MDFRKGRYARQEILPVLGKQGQEKLSKSKVTLIGCGALGTGIANNLARAGVGQITICDRDFVELNNLQRQTLFNEKNVTDNMPKAVAAAQHLKQVNSTIKIVPKVVDVNFTNIESLIEDADLVLDGVDNFQTRYLINDVCVKHKKPWVYGGCVSTAGMVLPVIPYETPCLRCVFPAPAPVGLTLTCDTAGVLNASAVIVASLQSTEALKILSGNRQDLLGKLLDFDVWENRYSLFDIQMDQECVCCVGNQFDFLDGQDGMQLTALCGRNAVQIVQRDSATIDLAEKGRLLSQLGDVKVTKFLLKFFVDDFELTLFPDGRAIVKGTDEEAVAKNIYSKYIGH